jgi:hypothetical protein
MEKEFVPYELALRLKALGFDEPCFNFYMGGFKELGKIKYVNPNNVAETNVLAPTFSQAFRWFREKHNVHAEITWSPSYEYEPRKWSDAIYEITFVYVSYTKEWKAESPDMQRGNGKQLTYEEAELECLRKLIELVEQKEK